MRGSWFWAVLLILAGVLLLFANLGLVSINIWEVVGPLALIALGAWVLWGVLFGRRAVEGEEVAIPLEGAARATVRIKHGAGRLRIGAGAGPDELLAGTFGGGLDYRVSRAGEAQEVEMRVPPGAFPFLPWTWGPGHTLDWTFGLNGEVPLSLELETGAGEARLDLTDLRVTNLHLQTGASSTNLTFPANAGHTRATIKAGAASVGVRIPDGVAARINAEGGLASISVDRDRFPREGRIYRSPDYDTAANKIDLDVETGVGSITIR